MKKIDGCKNNPENSSTAKVSVKSEYVIPSSFLMSVKSIEIRHDVCKDKDWMKKLCGFLREHAMEITNFKKKIMKLLTNERQESYEIAKICYVLRKDMKISIIKIKNILK